MTTLEGEDEEEQHLATLHELETTQEEIASYQGLLKDLPEIYERKFNERIKAILDRNQHLIAEREQLLHQLRQSLPPAAEDTPALTSAPPPAPAPAPPPPPAPSPASAASPRPASVDTPAQPAPPPPPPPTPIQATPAPPPEPVPAVTPAPPPEPVPEEPRARPDRWRSGWLAVIASLGVMVGLQLNNRQAATPSPPSSALPPTAQDPDPRQANLTGANGNDVRDRAIAQALAEWRFFGGQTIDSGRLVRAGRTEADPGQWQRILRYWREGALKDTLRGPADVSSNDNPWSAAFLAYVIRKAGAADQLLSASSHSGYIKEAIYNRQISANNAPLIGHRVTDYAPRPGDLLCAPRGWAIGKVSYDTAVRLDFFPSRCELVISTSANQITTIGGDLMDSVSRHQIAAKEGKIPPEAAQNWLVVIQTNHQ